MAISGIAVLVTRCSRLPGNERGTIQALSPLAAQLSRGMHGGADPSGGAAMKFGKCIFPHWIMKSIIYDSCPSFGSCTLTLSDQPPLIKFASTSDPTSAAQQNKQRTGTTAEQAYHVTCQLVTFDAHTPSGTACIRRQMEFEFMRH